MIEGLSHITFVVRDLDRMQEILCTVLDADLVYQSGDEQFSIAEERFYLAGGLWIAIMKGEPLKEKTYNHLAFKIWDDELDEYKERILALGLEIRQGRSRVEGEGRSLYFYDDDGHLFELHTGTLEERLKRYET